MASGGRLTHSLRSATLDRGNVLGSMSDDSIARRGVPEATTASGFVHKVPNRHDFFNTSFGSLFSRAESTVQVANPADFLNKDDFMHKATASERFN